MTTIAFLLCLAARCEWVTPPFVQLTQQECVLFGPRIAMEWAAENGRTGWRLAKWKCQMGEPS